MVSLCQLTRAGLAPHSTVLACECRVHSTTAVPVLITSHYYGTSSRGRCYYITTFVRHVNTTSLLNSIHVFTLLARTPVSKLTLSCKSKVFYIKMWQLCSSRSSNSICRQWYYVLRYCRVVSLPKRFTRCSSRKGSWSIFAKRLLCRQTGKGFEKLVSKSTSWEVRESHVISTDSLNVLDVVWLV